MTSWIIIHFILWMILQLTFRTKFILTVKKWIWNIDRFLMRLKIRIITSFNGIKFNISSLQCFWVTFIAFDHYYECFFDFQCWNYSLFVFELVFVSKFIQINDFSANYKIRFHFYWTFTEKFFWIKVGFSKVSDENRGNSSLNKEYSRENHQNKESPE